MSCFPQKKRKKNISSLNVYLSFHFLRKISLEFQATFKENAAASIEMG